jgi:transposase-like protein
MDATAEATRIDPDAVYTDAQLAAALDVTPRQLRRWRKRRTRGGLWFPRPFMRGRTPCWTGRAVAEWQERLQAEAEA